MMSDEADGRACTEADSRNGIEADSRWTRFRTQQNRLLWPSSLPACLQTAYEALPERRFLVGSGRRDSNPRQPAWKAGTLPTELLPHIVDQAQKERMVDQSVGVRG